VLDIAGLEPDVVVGLIERAIGGLAAAEGTKPDRVWGAGVVMPMLFEEGRPVPFGPTSMPAWQDYPIVERLGSVLAMPVIVENDATAAAVGEHLYGVGRRLRDFFYIYIGVGVGGGMILSGHPYRGSAGRAGELGHIVVVPGGRPCSCGNRGCLERYASLSAAQAVLAGAPEGAVAVEVAELAASEHRLGAWMDDAAAHLATACMMISNVLDPQAIVVGGIVPEPLLVGLLARLQDVFAASKRPAILSAEVNLETPALGGAALPFLNGLSPTISLLSKPTRSGSKHVSVRSGSALPMRSA
jgi:predicted NBD/HSP70 family sugar kinase